MAKEKIIYREKGHAGSVRYAKITKIFDLLLQNTIIAAQGSKGAKWGEANHH